MKTIVAIFFVLFLFPAVVEAQDFWQSYMQGLQIGMAQRRMETEERLAQQQIELMRQQSETMRQQRNDYLDSTYKQGFMDGYKKGTDDIVADVKKNEPANYVMAIDQLGKYIFKENSVGNLLGIKKNIAELKEQSPDLYVFRVYSVLVDDRLKELGYIPQAQKEGKKVQPKMK